MLLICDSSLIWYATGPCSEQVEFWPIDPKGWGGGVCRQNICYHFAALVIYLNLICNMVMFWKSCILTFRPPVLAGGGGGGGSLLAKYSLPCCCNCDSFNLICNMTIFWRSWILSFWPHHLSPPRGSDRCLWSKTMFDMFHNYFTSVCMRQFSKKCWQLTELLSNLNILHLTPPKGSRGGVKFLITVMFIYRHWVTMAYSEKLSDMIVLEKCEFYSTKSQYSFSISINRSQNRAINQ